MLQVFHWKHQWSDTVRCSCEAVLLYKRVELVLANVEQLVLIFGALGLQGPWF